MKGGWNVALCNLPSPTPSPSPSVWFSLPPQSPTITAHCSRAKQLVRLAWECKYSFILYALKHAMSHNPNIYQIQRIYPTYSSHQDPAESLLLLFVSGSNPATSVTLQHPTHTGTTSRTSAQRSRRIPPSSSKKLHLLSVSPWKCHPVPIKLSAPEVLQVVFQQWNR